MAETSLSFPDLIDEAIQLSGGEASTASEIVSARRTVWLTLQRWAQLGYNTWRVKTQVITLSGVYGPVALPSDLDDVLDIRVQAVDGTSRSALTRISRDAWMALGTPDTTGRPSQYWLDRATAPQLRVYPIGNLGDRIEIQYMARPASFDHASNGVDAPERWAYALTMATAQMLTLKRVPLDRDRYSALSSAAVDAERLAQANDRGRVHLRVS